MSVNTHYDDDVGEFRTMFCYFVCFVTRQCPQTTLHRRLKKTDHGTMYAYITTKRKRGNGGEGRGEDTTSGEIQRTEKRW